MKEQIRSKNHKTNLSSLVYSRCLIVVYKPFLFANLEFGNLCELLENSSALENSEDQRERERESKESKEFLDWQKTFLLRALSDSRDCQPIGNVLTI